jgi:hypothetical protein
MCSGRRHHGSTHAGARCSGRRRRRARAGPCGTQRDAAAHLEQEHIHHWGGRRDEAARAQRAGSGGRDESGAGRHHHAGSVGAGRVAVPLDLVEPLLELLPQLVAADEKVVAAVSEGTSVQEAFKQHRR